MSEGADEFKLRFGIKNLNDLFDMGGSSSEKDHKESSENAGIPIPKPQEGRVILILGPPGSGKSTLALQMACTAYVVKKSRGGANREGDPEGEESKVEGKNGERKIYPVDSIYLALEQTWKNIERMLDAFGWSQQSGLNNRIWRTETPVEEVRAYGSGRNLGKWYHSLCRKAGESSGAGKIIVPHLTPRNLSGAGGLGGGLFARRLTDVHALLDGYLACTGRNTPCEGCYETVREVAERQDAQGEVDVIQPEADGTAACKECPPLAMVVIDSLNVFGDKELDREEIFALADLFVRHGVIGILVAEEEFGKREQEPLDRFHPAEYVADVVIYLSTRREDGYLIRTIEITKSRYQAQVLGEHPYKILRKQEDASHKRKRRKAGDRHVDVGFRIYPSLHRQLSKNILPKPWPGGLSFGSREIDARLPAAWRTKTNEGPYRTQAPTILVTGEHGTFRSTLAMNFLLAGIGQGDNGLLLSLQEPVAPELMSILVFEENKNTWRKLIGGRRQDPAPLLRGKIQSTVWKRGKLQIRVLSFRPGFLLPEEFLETAIEQIKLLTANETGLRIVLDDTSEIPSRFPLLAKTRTAGRMFLPTLVDVVKGLGPIPLLVTALAAEAAKPESSLKPIADLIMDASLVSIYGKASVILKISTTESREILESKGPLELSIHRKDQESNGASRGNKEPGIIVADARKLEGLIDLDKGAPRRADLGVVFPKMLPLFGGEIPQVTG